MRLIEFVANNGLDGSVPPSVTMVNIVLLNQTPIANPFTVAANENTDIVIDLEGTDADGDRLTFTVATLPALGHLFQYGNGNRGLEIIFANTVVIDSDRRVIFAAAPDQNGTPYTQCGFTVNDGEVDSVEATVTVSVNAVNDLPTVSGAISVTTDEDAATVVVDLLAGAAGVDLSDVLRVNGPTNTGGDTAGFVVAVGGNSFAIEPAAYIDK